MTPVIALSSEIDFEDELLNINTFHALLDALHRLFEDESLSVGQELSANWYDWVSNLKSFLELDEFEINLSEIDEEVPVEEAAIQYQYSGNRVKAELDQGTCSLVFGSKLQFSESQKSIISEVTEHFKQALTIQKYFKRHIHLLHDLYDRFENLPICAALLDKTSRCQLINKKLIELCNKDDNFRLQDNFISYLKKGNDVLIESQVQLTHSESVIIELSDYIYVVKKIDNCTLAEVDEGFEYALFVFPCVLNNISKPFIESETCIELDLVKSGLSKKEAALAVYIGLGGSTHAYADAVSRSLKTIQTQLKTIYKKCHIHSQKELVQLIYTKRVDHYLNQIFRLNIGGQ